MKSAPKKWRKKPILIGLSIHCAAWWIWLAITSMRGSNWGSRWQRWLQIVWSDIADQVIAPFTFGPIFMTRAEFYGWAALRVLITVALVVIVYLAVKTQRRRVVVLAHCTVLLYWMASMAIVFSEIFAEASSF
jgi:hypothetical protein